MTKSNAVLVVEDDHDTRELVELTLAGEGYRVVTAREGREALVKVGLEMPGAIVLDMKMPVMDGWEFAREFRSRYSTRCAPIVVLTAAQSAAERAREIGADGYLDKPFDIRDLIRVVGQTMVDAPDALPFRDVVVDRAIQGDGDAFIALYDRHFDRVYRHIAARVHDTQDAEDLTQQVFLRAWAALGRYEQRGKPFEAWLFTIAHNLVVSFYRVGTVRHLARDLPDSRSDADPEQQAAAHWESERLRQAILALNPLQQQVIGLRFFQSWECRRVAEALGKSEANIRVIQYRALQQLRRILENDDR